MSPDNSPSLTNSLPKAGPTKAQMAVFCCFWDSYLELLRKLPDSVRGQFCEEAGRWFDTDNIQSLCPANLILVGVAWTHINEGTPLELPAKALMEAVEAYAANCVANA